MKNSSQPTQNGTHRARNYAWLALLPLLAFQNCAKTSFSSVSNSNQGADQQSHPGSCSTQLLQTTLPIKVLFVVDMSGSNVQAPQLSDPNKSIRGGSIQTFFNKYRTKANFGWGFITFQGVSATALINGGSSQSARYSDTTAMQSALNQFYSMLDDDTTPYMAALNLARQAITSDSSAPANTKYIIVFLSDGIPSDYDQSSAGDAQLAADTQSLVNLLPGRISLSSIYYGQVDDSASSRLRTMASVGGGQFLDTNSNPTGSAFQISDLVTIPGVQCSP